MPDLLQEGNAHCSTGLSNGLSAAEERAKLEQRLFELEGFGVGYLPNVRSSSPGARGAEASLSRVHSAPMTSAMCAVQAAPYIQGGDPEIAELRALIAERDGRIRELESCLRRRSPAPLASGTGLAAFAELAGTLRAAPHSAQVAPATNVVAGMPAPAASIVKSDSVASSAGSQTVVKTAARREPDLQRADDLCTTCARRTIPSEPALAQSPANVQSFSSSGRLTSGTHASRGHLSAEAPARLSHGALKSTGTEARVPCIEAAAASKMKRDMEESACSTSRSWRTLTPGRSSYRQRHEQSAGGKPETGEYSFAAPVRSSRPLVRPGPAIDAMGHASSDPPTVRVSVSAARSPAGTSTSLSPTSPTPRTSASQLQKQLLAQERVLANGEREVTGMNAITCCPNCGSSFSSTPGTPLIRQVALGDFGSDHASLQHVGASNTVASDAGGTGACGVAEAGASMEAPSHWCSTPEAGSSALTSGSDANDVPSFIADQTTDQELLPPTVDAASQMPEPSLPVAQKRAAGHWTPLPRVPSASLLQEYLPKADEVSGGASGLEGECTASTEAAVAAANNQVVTASRTETVGDSTGSAAGVGAGEDTDGVEPTAQRTCYTRAELPLEHMALSQVQAPPPWPRKLSAPPSLASEDSIALSTATPTAEDLAVQNAQPPRKSTPLRHVNHPSSLGQYVQPSRKSTTVRRTARPSSHVILAPAHATVEPMGRRAPATSEAETRASNRLTAKESSAATASSPARSTSLDVQPPPARARSTSPEAHMTPMRAVSTTSEPQETPTVEPSADQAETLAPRVVTVQTARQSLGRSATLLSRMKHEARGRQLPPAMPLLVPAPVLTSSGSDLPRQSSSLSPPAPLRRNATSLEVRAGRSAASLEVRAGSPRSLRTGSPRASRAGSPRTAAAEMPSRRLLRSSSINSRQSPSAAQRLAEPTVPKLRHQVDMLKHGWR